MKKTVVLAALLGAAVLLAGCSGGETLDEKDSVAGQMKGLKNVPAPPRDGIPKVNQDTKKPEPKGSSKG